MGDIVFNQLNFWLEKGFRRECIFSTILGFNTITACPSLSSYIAWFKKKHRANWMWSFLLVLHRPKESANKITWNQLVKSTSMSQLSCIFLRCWDFPILNHHLLSCGAIDASKSPAKSGEIHRKSPENPRLRRNTFLLRDVILHI